MTHLIIADIQNGAVNAATLSTVQAATVVGGDIDLLIVGPSDAVANNAASIAHVTKVLYVNGSDNVVAEDIAPIVTNIASNYSHIWAAAGSFGKNVMPRIAALLDVQQVSDISAIINANTFERPIYAGNAMLTVESHETIHCITVRGTSFEAVDDASGNAAIEHIGDMASANLSRFVRTEATKSERPELTTAGIVVSGGRGMASQENFAMLESLAGVLNAAVGASRAAVDAGYAPNDYQVGQTGKVVAPNLYIAIGISGAIQHLAGMKDSKIIVAVNKDDEAPIFQVADYGIVGDLFDVVPQLEAALQKAL